MIRETWSGIISNLDFSTCEPSASRIARHILADGPKEKITGKAGEKIQGGLNPSTLWWMFVLDGEWTGGENFIATDELKNWDEISQRAKKILADLAIYGTAYCYTQREVDEMSCIRFRNTEDPTTDDVNGWISLPSRYIPERRCWEVWID